MGTQGIAVGTQGIKFLSLPTGCKEMECLCLQRMAISIKIIFLIASHNLNLQCLITGLNLTELSLALAGPHY